MFSELAKLFGIKKADKAVQSKETANKPEPEKKLVQEECAQSPGKGPVDEHSSSGILRSEPEPATKSEPYHDKETEPELLSKPESLPDTRGRESKKSKKRSKNGLPVLSSDFDFENAFEETSEPESALIEEIRPAESIKLEEMERPATEIPMPQTNAPKKASPVRIDKKGIPRLTSDHDLEKLMETGIEGVERTEPPPPPKRQAIKQAKNKIFMDKNRIPILPKDSDLAKEFKSESEKEFHELLSKNLAGKSQNALLRNKKQEAAVPKPIPVEQRIKRYPGPQEELDLHGFTAIEADRKTDIFIRSARKKGLFTVKIIVGKGLHSQGRAVLPDVVEDRISALKNEKEVLTFRWEKRLKTQSGALIVYLNQYD